MAERLSRSKTPREEEPEAQVRHLRRRRRSAPGGSPFLAEGNDGDENELLSLHLATSDAGGEPSVPPELLHELLHELGSEVSMWPQKMEALETSTSDPPPSQPIKQEGGMSEPGLPARQLDALLGMGSMGRPQSMGSPLRGYASDSEEHGGPGGPSHLQPQNEQHLPNQGSGLPNPALPPSCFSVQADTSVAGRRSGRHTGPAAARQPAASARARASRPVPPSAPRRCAGMAAAVPGTSSDTEVVRHTPVPCQSAGCVNHAEYGAHGIRQFCLQHLPLVELKTARRRLCTHEGCTKQAKTSAEGVFAYCKGHMAEHGVHARSTCKRCAMEGCERFAKKNMVDGSWTYCKAHLRTIATTAPLALGTAAAAAMRPAKAPTVTKRCEVQGCDKHAKRSQGGCVRFCKAHMKEYNLVPQESHPHCQHPGCERYAKASTEGVWKYCKAHMQQYGMWPRDYKNGPGGRAAAPAAAGVPPSSSAAVSGRSASTSASAACAYKPIVGGAALAPSSRHLHSPPAGALPPPAAAATHGVYAAAQYAAAHGGGGHAGTSSSPGLPLGQNATPFNALTIEHGGLSQCSSLPGSPHQRYVATCC